MLIELNIEITDFRDGSGGKISSLKCITGCRKQVKILSNLKDCFYNLNDMCNKSLKYAVALLVIDTCNIFPGQGRGARVAASAQQTGHEPLKWNDQHQRGRGQKCQRQGAPLEEVKQVLQFLQRSKILSPQAVPNITFWSENLTVGLSKNAKNWHTRCARWWTDEMTSILNNLENWSWRNIITTNLD